MAVNYDDIYAQQRQKAQQQQNDYATQRNNQSSAYSNDINSIYDKQNEYQNQAAQKQASGMPAQYQPQYDKNAVQELISRRYANENAANMGLTNSGYNRMQQTAASVQKQNSDAANSRAIQDAIDKINQQAQANIQDNELSRQQKLADISQSSGNDILNNYTALMNAAAQNASSQYNTEITSEQAAYDRALQQQIADSQSYASQQQLAEQKREADLNSQYNQQQLTQNQQNTIDQLSYNTYMALINQGKSPSIALSLLQDYGLPVPSFLSTNK